MSAAKHIEYMDRAMNAGAMPSPYMAQREIDITANEAKAIVVQHYASGVAEGWRQARGWLARNTAALIAFGVCVGVTLAVVCAPMVGFMLGAGA